MKKIIKKISLILLLILISGCKANYEINLNDDFFQEKLTFIETRDNVIHSNDYRQKLNRFLENGLYTISEENFLDYVEDGTKYTINKIETNGLGAEIIGITPKSLLTETTIVNVCFNNIKITTKDKKTKIETSKDFSCFDSYSLLEEVKVKVISNNILVSNADLKEHDNHVWIFTKENYKDKNIKLEINNLPDYIPEKKESTSKPKEEPKQNLEKKEDDPKSNYQEKDRSSSNIIKEKIVDEKNKSKLLIILGSTLIIIAIFIIYIYFRQRKINKI